MGGGRKNTSDRLIAGVGGSKEAETNVAENSGRETKEPKDLAELRGWIATEVRVSGGTILGALIQKAKEGQVPAARYLFEIAGVYPATAENSSKPEDSPAYALFKKMGLAIDGTGEENLLPVVTTPTVNPDECGSGSQGLNCAKTIEDAVK